MRPSHRKETTGVAYGIVAYATWGVAPVYFKAVAHVPPLQVLAHRIVWAVVLLATLIILRRQWNAIVIALRSSAILLTLCGTTILIAVNWFAFIWAVAHDQVLQASLGYFINPLVNVLLGYVFLRERLRPLQLGSVALASAGVIYLTLSYEQIPWLALTLAGSFAFYGLLRKTAKVEALVGLTIETSMLAPVALCYLVYLGLRGEGTFRAESIQTDFLLAAAGIVTAVPLICFTNAARRLRLATLGFLQYLAPTGHFLLAVFAYGEPFTRTHVISFSCIWGALFIYTLDMRRAIRDARPSLTQ